MSVVESVCCPICRESRLTTLVQRRSVSVFQNHLYRDEALATAAPTGDINLSICESCGFVHNRAFDPKRVAYGGEYENDQSYSDVFLSHMDAMADRIVEAFPRNGTLIEIGCGQGNFLFRLARRMKDSKPKLCGFDPSYRPAATQKSVTISARTFDRQVVAGLDLQPDVLVSRHVIEHVSDPIAFLSAARESAAHEGVRLYLETPCFDWIVSNRVVQDIFYEHVNYFTAATLTDALRRAGFGSASVEHVFGGQYLWADAVTTSATKAVPAIPKPENVIVCAKDFARDVDAQSGYWNALLGDGVRTAIWGAGAKGITLASLVDPRRERVTCLIDRNPRKQGAFVPVTAHPIVAAREAAKRNVSRALIVNPHYHDEIAAEASALGWNVQLIDVGAENS